MAELLVLCEGHTEREFFRDILASELAMKGVNAAATLVGKPQRKRGGIRPWQVYESEIMRLAKESPQRHVGVLVDYYAMPHCWPGRTDAPKQPIAKRGLFVENALRQAMSTKLRGRFHPCVQLHEFESLMFIDPAVTAEVLVDFDPGKSAIAYKNQITKVLESHGKSIEAINDSPETAPSKRLVGMTKAYDKVAIGPTVATFLGLERLRSAPWLNRWVEELIQLGSN